MDLRKSKLQLLRAIRAFVITLFAIQSIDVWFLIHSVNSIVSATKQLRPGVSTQEEVEAFAKRFQLFAGRDNGCESDSCNYDFVISNVLLSLPKIAPSATFIVFLRTRNRQLDQIDVGIFRAESRWSRSSRVVRLYDGPYHIPDRPYYRVTGPDYDPVIAIWLDPGASSAQRSRAYDFEAKCIALPFGCNRPCDFHREAWRDAKEFSVPPPAHDRRGTFRLAACK